MGQNCNDETKKAWQNSLGQTLRRRGITAAQLEPHAGVDRSMLSRIARGLRCPSLETARKIASALGMSIERVFFSDAGEG